MISFEEALERMLAAARVLPRERVELAAARGRYLARDVIAREAIPLFDQSSMDGYAVRAADLKGASEEGPVLLAVVGEIRAGGGNAECGMRNAELGNAELNVRAEARTPNNLKSAIRIFTEGANAELGNAECGMRNAKLNVRAEARTPNHLKSAIRIFTGAVIPSGFDTVVMKEYCEEIDYEHEHIKAVLVRKAELHGANIRRRGEEFAQGTRVLSAGMKITPAVAGLLATLGVARPEVHRQPRVGLIVTGDELRKPGEKLGPGQIRDANSYTLAAALEEMGLAPAVRERAGDDPESIRRALSGALAECEVAITVGGVSVGDYDFIKAVAAEIGVREVYWKVAIKPGMPNYFGVFGRKGAEKLVLGLPGNPVAALVSFELFVRPALLKMCGARDAGTKLICAKLGADLKKRHGRLEWVRGLLVVEGEGKLSVTPTVGQESHMLGGLAAANCLVEFPAGRNEMKLGETARVILIAGCGLGNGELGLV